MSFINLNDPLFADMVDYICNLAIGRSYGYEARLTGKIKPLLEHLNIRAPDYLDFQLSIEESNEESKDNMVAECITGFKYLRLVLYQDSYSREVIEHKLEQLLILAKSDFKYGFLIGISE
jgi:hypothetical protein